MMVELPKVLIHRILGLDSQLIKNVRPIGF
nr:MAG TPA: hypothetical protein [Caudoviricetes sp.]